MTSVKCRLACCAANMTVGDFSGNAQKIWHFIEQAQRQQADVIVFPELALCGYNPRDLLWTPGFLSHQYDQLLSLATKVQHITAIVGFAESYNGLIYNSAAILAGGQIFGIARKKHLTNEGFINETRYFTSGEGAAYFQVGSASFKVLVNEDMYFEEDGSQDDTLCICGASPFYKEHFNNMPSVLQHHAVARRAAIAYANYIGGNDESVFSGEARIYDGDGKLVSRSQAFIEDLVIADIQLKIRKSKKTLAALKKIPVKEFIKQKITTEEDDEHRILRALVLGVKDYAVKCGFKKVILGLSGGVDSSLTAAIAVLALGAENVQGLLMPSQFSTEHSISDARFLAETLGIKWNTISIEPIFKAYIDSMPQEFSEHSLAKQNIQARIRANILMGFSNKYGYMVLPTSNKSEIFAGYGTLYGDVAGAFMPLKDIAKGLVYRLCYVANELLGVKAINESILSKEPSAELFYGQKDQDTLPPYPMLDNILQSYIEEGQDFTEMARNGVNISLAKEMVLKSLTYQFKMRQLPLGVAITPKSFNNNRVMPIAQAFKL